jgi:HTH-type transcriptional regulator/antitoxin HigA
LQYRPIKSLAQYKSYESYLEKLIWIKEKSQLENEETDLLIALIKKWDTDHNTISAVLPKAVAPDPIKILDTFMKENKLNPSDLASTLGISQSAISDILNYRKELTDDIIARLSEKYKVSPDVFRITV